MSKKESKTAALPPSPLPDFFLVGGDDILRDSYLDNCIQCFREEFQARFGKEADLETYRSADGRYFEYCPLGLDWRVVHRNKGLELFWVFRGDDFEGGSSSLDSALKMVSKRKKEEEGEDSETEKKTKEEEEDDSETEKKTKEEEDKYDVDRDPFWTPIVKAVMERVGQQGPVLYHLQHTYGEPDYVVFNVDNRWIIRAKKDGTFEGELFDVYLYENKGTLDKVLAWLDPTDPDKRFEHSVRIRISRHQKQLARIADDRVAWKQAQQSATELQLLLSRLDYPDWGPETNTRSFYFGLGTLIEAAKTKVAELPLDLERVVVNDCLKEMTNLCTEEMVKRLELVSKLVKEQKQ